MTLISDWEHVRIEVLKRDNHTCQDCGKGESLDVHHKIPRRYGGLDIPENLVTLCSKCHMITERQIQRWGGCHNRRLLSGAFEGTVSKFSNSGHVICPKDWIGMR